MVNMSGGATFVATGSLRMQFTGQNLLAAGYFSRRVGEIERAHAGEQFGAFYDEILWNASASVILAAAAIETHVNELFADHERHFTRHASTLVKELWKAKERSPLLDKYDLALRLRDNSELERGADPTESMNTLLDLRNELVHFKPEWSNEAEVQGKPTVHTKVSQRLASKIDTSPFLPGEPPFPRAWATHSCTQWAVKTALAFGSSIAKHFDQKNVFDQFAERAAP